MSFILSILSSVFTLQNLIFMITSVFLGIIIGSIPGLAVKLPNFSAIMKPEGAVNILKSSERDRLKESQRLNQVTTPLQVLQ